MKLLTLRSVYKNLLREAILDQSTFLFRLSDIIENRPDLIIKDHSLLGNVLKSIKDTELKNLQGAKNKKARKKAEIAIHKNLRNIKGISGEPINLKKMRPLYDSIIQFLSTKKDVDIEHCLLAADYYMNDFYDNANTEEKNLVNNGKIDFGQILKVTKFYQQYFEFKDTLGLFQDSSFKVYSDENINVVYPQTPFAFNNFISNTGISVDWCTQSPSTWQGYNKRQFVMIIHDLVGDEGIISLKVNFDGSVDYDGTCDQYNKHMDKYSVRDILPAEGEEAIKRVVDEGKINTAAAQDFDPTKVSEYLRGLLDANNYEEIYSLLIAVSQTDSTGDLFFEAIEDFIDYSISIEKIDQALEIFVDVSSSLNFDNQDFLLSSCHVALRNNNVENVFKRLLINKCLNKRSHAKYFITFCELYNKPVHSGFLNNVSDQIKQMAVVAFDKTNPVNFKKIISAITTSNELTSLLIKKDYFADAFSTKGFKVYFDEKKDKIKVLDSEDYSFHPMGDRSEMFISKLIDNNKESFIDFIQKYNAEEENNVSIESLDYSLIARYILHRSNFQKYEISNINLEGIAPHTFDMQAADLKEIADNIYTDLELVKFLCEKSNLLTDALLSHYLSIEVPWLQDKSRNSSISFDNQESYQIFLYLLKNSFEKIPRLIKVDQPSLSIASDFKHIISLITKFGGTPQSLDSEIKEILVKIASRSIFFKGLFRKNYPLDNNLVDFYFEIISNVEFQKESLDAIKSCILTLEFLNKNTSNAPLEKLASKIVAMPQVKNSIIADAQSSSADIEEIYVMFYLLDYVDVSTDVITSICAKYIDIISSNPGNEMSAALFKKLKNSGKQINAKMVSSMVLSKDITKSIGELIDKNSFWQNFYFSDFIFMLVERCNKENIGFYKEHLSKIFYNSRFKNLDNNTRQSLLTNFISKGSDTEENYLDTRDRVIVRDCLKDCLIRGDSLEKDYDFIMDLCKNLDRYSKFQIRTAFPKEERLAEVDVNESLIKNYIRLFFG